MISNLVVVSRGHITTWGGGLKHSFAASAMAAYQHHTTYAMLGRTALFSNGKKKKSSSGHKAFYNGYTE